MRFKQRHTPDSNIVLAQIQPTSGPCEIHAGQMWAGSGPTLLAVWESTSVTINVLFLASCNCTCVLVDTFTSFYSKYSYTLYSKYNYNLGYLLFSTEYLVSSFGSALASTFFLGSA